MVIPGEIGGVDRSHHSNNDPYSYQTFVIRRSPIEYNVGLGEHMGIVELRYGERKDCDHRAYHEIILSTTHIPSPNTPRVGDGRYVAPLDTTLGDIQYSHSWEV